VTYYIESIWENKAVLSRNLLSICLLTLLLMLAARPCSAQINTSGTINGTVTDPTGAVLPHAHIQIKNMETGTVTQTMTNAAGIFAQVGLPSGKYEVSIFSKGFSTFNETGLYLEPAGTYTANAVMKPGSSSETVTVMGSEDQVQLSTDELSSTVSGEEAEELPLNGRNYEALAALMPGVINTSVGTDMGTGGYTTDTSLSVNGGAITTPGGQGAAQNAAVAFVDGIWNSASVEHQQTIITPNPDAISQLKVLKNNWSARDSVMGASVVLVQTKSGTDQYHGTLWEFIRNTAFDAVPYLGSSPSVLHWNIFGWDFGGPLSIPHVYNPKKKKLFFYFNQQWVRQTAGEVTTGLSAPATMRGIGTPNGEALFPMTGALATATGTGTLYLKDPTATGSCNASSNAACFPTDGNGNYIIPANRLDQNAILLLNALSDLPNDSATGLNFNYRNTNANVTNQMDILGKLDYDLSSRFRITGEYLSEEQVFSGANAARMGSPFSKNYDVFDTDNQAGQVRLTQLISSSMANETSLATSVFDVTHDFGGIHLISQVPGFHQNLPYSGGYLQNYLPQITFSNAWSQFGTASPYIVPRATEVHGTFADDWSWQRGKHFLQAGGIMLFGTERHTATTGSTQGSWSFGGSYTGHPIADYLLGDAFTFEQTNAGTRAIIKYTIFSPYIEDQWKATRHLTLTGGLRWFRMPSPTEQAAQITAFNPASFDPAAAPTVAVNGVITPTPNYNEGNGLILNGVNGVPFNLSDAHKYYFSPSAGFALDVFGDGRISLRGGWGLTHNETAGQGCAEQGCLGFPVLQQFHLANANFTSPVGATVPPVTAGAVFGEDLQGYKAANIQTYSLSLEQQFGTKWIAMIAGAGSTTRGIADPNINQPLPIPGYDFNPLLNTSDSSAYFAPYQGYSSINYWEYVLKSHWTGLEASLRHYAGKNLYLTAAYTWSHNLDNLGGFQNSYNLQSAYGNSTYSVPQAFTASVVYNLPRFQNARRLTRTVLGGWKYADMTSFYAGPSLTAGLSSGTRGLATRPNQIAPVTYSKRATAWFSTGSFANPAPGFFGTVGNGTLRGPGVEIYNMSLYKEFYVKDRVNFEFRAEFFNAFNHLNLGNPNTSLGNVNDGQITSARNPREVEFAFKIKF
jgi:hypothetical protein